MKYAVVTVADQTVVYTTADGSETTICAEAKLWDSKEEAEAIAAPNGDWSEVEDVGDETKFRLQYDTWTLEDDLRAPSGHILRPGSRPTPIPESVFPRLQEVMSESMRNFETDSEEWVFYQYIGTHIMDELNQKTTMVDSMLKPIPDKDKPTRAVFEAVYLPHDGPITMVESVGSRHIYSLYFLGTPEDLMARISILDIMSS